MERVLKHVEDRAERLHDHLLFQWIDSDDVPPDVKLRLLPSLVNFTMGFRDLNKWVLRYSHPRDELEAGIDIHTFEDQTHSRLFMEDWHRLRLDDHLGWRASDTLWWLFLAEDNEVPRAQGAYLRALAIADGGDPVLRFAHSEVMEACGAVFFAHASKVAETLTAQTGIDYRYMGPYHLARESGHMACEELFESQRLDSAKRERALRLVDAMFTLFENLFHSMLRYARTYVASDLVPRPPAAAAVSRNGDAPPPPGGESPPPTDAIHPSQTRLQRLLDERRAHAARHAFYLWLRESDESRSLETLRRFIPTWAMEIMGYRDLVWYAMRYATPADELERAVNRWVGDLQTHSSLFLVDWRELDLDDVLGWRASDTLEYYFLDPQMDRHRHNFIKFTELAAGHADPVLRLWLIEALEATGWDFFAHTSALAAKVEETEGLRLDYLIGRHHVAHAHGQPGEPVAFKDRPLDPASADIVATMINTAFDVMEEHLAVSLEAAISDRFGIAAAREVRAWSEPATR